MQVQMNEYLQDSCLDVLPHGLFLLSPLLLDPMFSGLCVCLCLTM
jgi:hypothetical protein